MSPAKSMTWCRSLCLRLQRGTARTSDESVHCPLRDFAIVLHVLASPHSICLAILCRSRDIPTITEPWQPSPEDCASLVHRFQASNSRGDRAPVALLFCVGGNKQVVVPFCCHHNPLHGHKYGSTFRTAPISAYATVSSFPVSCHPEAKGSAQIFKTRTCITPIMATTRRTSADGGSLRMDAQIPPYSTSTTRPRNPFTPVDSTTTTPHPPVSSDKTSGLAQAGTGRAFRIPSLLLATSLDTPLLPSGTTRTFRSGQATVANCGTRGATKKRGWSTVIAPPDRVVIRAGMMSRGRRR
ncbi:hypothetical protein OF83DRAFT_1136878, partial [Amylostereum chailletii]